MLSYARVGWSLTAVALLWHAAALIHQATLTGDAAVFHNNMIAAMHPWYTALTAQGVLLVLVEAVIYAWVITWVFVSVYNAVKK